jgi:hypothetical protein
MTFRPFAQSAVLLAVALSAFPSRSSADPVDHGWFARTCASLFGTTASSLPKPHQFKPLTEVDFAKSALLEDRTVKNQGSYGCCWISATHANYQRALYSRFGREIPLSDDYLILISLFYRIEEGVHHGAKIIEGGWTFAGDWLVNRVGMVPEEAWKPKIDLRDPNSKEGKKLVAYLNEQIALFQAETLALKNSSGTWANLEAMAQAWDRAQETKSRLYRHLRDTVGNPPSSFEIDGVRYTPHSFARAVIPNLDQHTVLELSPKEPRIPSKPKPLDDSSAATPAPDTRFGLFTLFPDLAQRLPKTKSKINPAFPGELDSNRYRLYSRSRRGNFDARREPLSEIHARIGARLEVGESIHVSTSMVKKFYDSKTGVMSISAHGFTLKDAQQAEFSGGHAMLITGVYRSRSGKILGYRLQNSWGERFGQLGYYYMDKDYFDAFVTSVTFTKKPPAAAPPKPVLLLPERAQGA